VDEIAAEHPHLEALLSDARKLLNIPWMILARAPDREHVHLYAMREFIALLLTKRGATR